MATAHWSFMISGLVDLPLPLSYKDLLALHAVEQACTLACIGHTPGGTAIGHARWYGVPIRALMDDMSIQPGAGHAHLHAADGYATSVELLQFSNALLAYKLNDEPLPPEHGYPVRLIVPGLYGYKMPKWIQRVVLADQPLDGLWEKRGWSPSGQVQTTSAILGPRHRATISGVTTLHGYAFAGDRAITSVEVSIDDGPWMPVPFTQNQAQEWALWSTDWSPATPGDHRIQVRATDATGWVQQDSTANAFPNGSSAIHSIVVHMQEPQR